MTDEPIPLHSRVALRGGFEVVYPSAWAGTEGWIRGQRTDEDGFDQVFIEWDKGHWRYSGESDLWTFANHFRAIGPPDLPAENDPRIAEFLDLSDIPAPEPAGERCPDCGEIHPSQDDDWQVYFDVLQRASDKAADSDNFVLLTFAPLDGKPDLILPHFYVSAMEPEDVYRLFAHMGELANRAMKTLVAERATRGGHDGRTPPDVPTNDQE